MTTCLIIYWVAVAGYLYSAGDVTIETVAYSASNALTLSVSALWCCSCGSGHVYVPCHLCSMTLVGNDKNVLGSSGSTVCLKSFLSMSQSHRLSANTQYQADAAADLPLVCVVETVCALLRHA